MKIAILHLGRCGSTVLSNLFKWNHKQLVYDIEDPFTHNKDRDPIELLKKGIEKCYKDNFMFNCKPFYEESLGKGRGIDMELDDFLKSLKEDIGIDKIIVLKRNNYLRRTISGLISFERDVWHNNVNFNEENGIDFNSPHKIKIEKDHCNYYVNELFPDIDDWYQKVESVADLILTYEGDIERNPNLAYYKLCNFMQIKPLNEVTNYLQKTNPFTAEETVENFEVMEQVFKGTKYEWMLYK